MHLSPSNLNFVDEWHLTSHAQNTMNVHRGMKYALMKTTHIESSNLTLTACYGLYRDTQEIEGVLSMALMSPQFVYVQCNLAVQDEKTTFTSIYWLTCPYAADSILCIIHVEDLHMSVKTDSCKQRGEFWHLMILIMTRKQT